MFDWFRKKKKSEPEAPVTEELTQNDVLEESEEADFEENSSKNEEAWPAISEPSLTVEAAASGAPSEETEDKADSSFDGGADEQTEEENLQEETAAKKGFFARFREKLSGGESSLASSADEEKIEDDLSGSENLQDDLPPATKAAIDDSAKTEEVEEERSDSAQDFICEDDTTLEKGSAPSDDEAAEAPKHAEYESFSVIESSTEDRSGPGDEAVNETGDSPLEPETEEQMKEAEDQENSKGLFSRFKEKLSATRDQLAGRIESLLSSVRSIDDDLLDELEELLITSDLGIKTTEDLLYKIRGQVASKELDDVEALKQALKKRIKEMVSLPSPPRPNVKPMVIMVVGINGVGKTTTIAKLARRFKEDEKQKVLLAAGDTFRSAAVDQLIIWAERLEVDVISQPTGADASAVVFDALTAAQARGSDVVIIDTAGRLHTKVNLMDELKKIKRVANKAMPGAPHHTILVLDGNTGQNALRQAQTFHEAVGIDSIIVTKLDGTAKGGVIVSISHELKIPIAFVGLGESFEDLQPFDSDAFTEAILAP